MAFGSDDASLVSALLIKLPASADRAAARRRLEEALPEADFFTTAELGETDRAFGARLLGSILSLVSGITWLIALLTMAMLRFSDVHANLRQYGIQKALGAGPMELSLALIVGGAITALLALPPALLIANVLAEITAAWHPLYNARIWEKDVIARSFAVALVASIGGSLIPLRRLVRLDPVIVFQR